MMISYLKPMAAGNAVRIMLTPPAGASRWKVLRRMDADFTTHDAADVAVALGAPATSTVDFSKLKDGAVYYYKPFYLIGADWVGSDVESVLVTGQTRVVGCDPLSIVRERVEVGLRKKVADGALVHKSGLVPCLTAPPTFENARFPIVTFHLESDRSQHRALGEMVEEDLLDDEGNWVEGEGWIGAHNVKIVTWSPENADVRLALRLAVKEILMANMPIFRSAGMDQVDFTLTDVEDMQSYNVPVYQTVITFTCVAPYIVVNTVDPISDVTVTVNDA
jgi:hypothetical protein